MLIPARGGLDDAGLAEAVEAFLAAYLTGVGDLSRYTVPASPLVAVSPPPFATVEITSAGEVTGSDGTRFVAARITATDTAGQEQVLEYSMVVVQRDGRWEVAELLPAPLLAN
jgi:hypothetical protein